MSGRLHAVLVALIFLAALGATPTPTATVGPAPTVDVLDVQVYRHVGTLNDLWILGRINLPVTDWCNELEDTTGCPDDPDTPTGLAADKVFVVAYQGSGASRVLVDIRRVPRVGHGLAGLYLAPGHGIAWEEPTLEFCVESSSTLYSPQASNCSPVAWQKNLDGTDPETRADTREVLEFNLPAIVRDLELARAEAFNTFVTDFGITATGRVFAEEALSAIGRIAPGAFEVSASVAELELTPTTTDPALVKRIREQAEVSGAFIAWDNFSTEYLGVAGVISGGFVFGGLGTVAAALTYVKGGRHPLISFATFFSFLVFGGLVAAPQITVAIVFALLLFVGFATWLADMIAR